MKWQSYKLKEVGEVVTGNTPPTTQREYYGTQYKFIKPTDMREGQRYVPITEEYYSELAYQKYRKSLLPVNTPCVVTIGSLGKKMCLTDEPSFTNQAVNAVIPNENFDGEFLYYCLRTRLPYVKQLDSGTTSGRENVSKSSFSNIVIEAPSLAIQKRIASILSAYDNLIENNNKRIKILEQMAENLYKEWFVRFRFPGHETTPLENGIPKGWKLKHVSEIGDIIGGGTPSTDNEEYWNGNIPWLSPADLTDYQGVYIDKGANNITELGLAKSSAKMMPKDTVLLSSRAPIGYVALAKNDICTNQGFKSIVCNQSIMKPSYLYLYFKLNKSYLQSFASGATFPELSGSMVKKLKVLVPDISLLEKFDTFAKKLFEKTDVLLTQNQNLIKQRDLLLPRLMSGKLAV